MTTWEAYGRINARQRLAKASDYIEHFKSRPGDKVVIACRVSTIEQKRKQTLTRHVAEMQRIMKRRGVAVVGDVQHVGSGVDPSWLWEAVLLAEMHGATIVAMSTDRLIRSPFYHSEHNPDAVAGNDDLERLRAWTEGVPVATVSHPDLHPAKVRSRRILRGQRATGHYGGRPALLRPGYKKRWREEVLPVVLRLHRRGLGYRDIASWTDVPEATVRRWLKGQR